MTSINKIRNELIEKIMTIRDKDYLLALDKLIISSEIDTNEIQLTAEQKEMLAMSELDIKNGRLISQEVMDKRNLEWLSER